MTTKKARKPTELALTAARPDVMKPIRQIAELAGALGEDPVATVTLDTVDKAVEALARVREAQRKLDAAGKEVTQPLKDQIKPFDTERLALEKQLKAADKAIADRLVDLYLHDPEGMAKRMEGALGSTATFVQRGVEVEVIDADKVPDFLLSPLPTRAERVNKTAIAALVETGQPVPDGVRVTKRYTLTTRAAELIQKLK